MNYNTYTLSSGMRVVHLPSASQVVYMGIGIAAGARNEEAGQEGLAHFCEHLTFKGTQRRSAMQVINALEGVGGELNAFTNKEDTVFYAAIQRDHARQAVDVLCDIVFHSAYPQAEIEKECEVVCDEIESYEDSPAELIFDEFENILFGGHPLGHNILGTVVQVRSYTHDDACWFTKRWYRPDNAVFFASGDLNFNRLTAWLESRVATMESVVSETSTHETVASVTVTAEGAPVVIPPLTVQHKDTHQAHVMIGARAYAVGDNRRWALYLLNNILGGPGLNSRLNLSLRERHALVYTVESSMVSYGDTGAWSVYFGCDPHDVDHCRRLVVRELQRLMHQPLSPRQLAAAKRQLKGQLAIVCDNRESFALDFAKTFLHSGKVRDMSDVFAHVDSLSADDLQQTACDIFAPERLCTLIYR